MLIIAIPKSASTSLMKTIGKLHHLENTQNFEFKDNPPPAQCQVLHTMHSDVRELDMPAVEAICHQSVVNKQHIFPSRNNLELLRGKKKVVLLRKPKDIIMAYKRGAHSKVHSLLDGYSLDFTEEQWLEQAQKDGLYNDLNFFTEQWTAETQQGDTLIVHYEDYVNQPEKVINQIEAFYGLPLTQGEIETEKARYSRRSPLASQVHLLKEKVKSGLSKFVKRLGAGG